MTTPQHESSVTHQNLLDSGLHIEWIRFTGCSESDFSVVCYSDGSRWLYDNGSARLLTVLGEVPDGLGRSEILRDDSGVIIALYADGPQAFPDMGEWLESMPESDRAAAEAAINDSDR